jgi:hypothetical protein
MSYVTTSRSSTDRKKEPKIQIKGLLVPAFEKKSI